MQPQAETQALHAPPKHMRPQAETQAPRTPLPPKHKTGSMPSFVQAGASPVLIQENLQNKTKTGSTRSFLQAGASPALVQQNL